MIKIFTKDYWTNIRKALVSYNDDTANLESLYGKPLVYINRTIDHPFTIIDASICTIIIGSIFYSTTKEFFWSYFVGFILSFLGHYVLQYSVKLSAISFAYKLVKRDDKAKDKKGYILMRWAFIILSIALLAIAIPISLKTDIVVKVSGKENLKEKIKSEESVMAKYEARRIASDSFYNGEIAQLNKEIIEFDTSGAYRNRQDKILVYWKNQRKLAEENRADRIVEKGKETVRLDNLEATALAVLRQQNNEVKGEFEDDFAVSGKYANGANLAVTLIRILWQFIYAFFIRYATKETDDLAAEIEEREQLAKQKKEQEAADRKRLHEEAVARQQADAAATRKIEELAAFKRAQEARKVEADNQVKLMMAKAEAQNLVKEKELEVIRENKKLEEATALLELEKVKEMRKMEEARGQQIKAQNEAANKLRQQQIKTANIKEVANIDNANMNANANTVDANKQSYFANRPLVPTSFVGNANSANANTMSANKYMPTPTPTGNNVMGAGVGILTKPDKTRQSQQVKPAKTNIKAITKAMKVVYQNNVPGVVVGGKWRNRRDVGSTLSANKGRAARPDATQTVKDNVELFSYARMLIDAENKKG